jgi:hypothetical protein
MRKNKGYKVLGQSEESNPCIFSNSCIFVSPFGIYGYYIPLAKTVMNDYL